MCKLHVVILTCARSQKIEGCEATIFLQQNIEKNTKYARSKS